MEGPGTVGQDGNPASIPPSLNVDVQAMMSQQPSVFGTYGSDASPVTPLGAPAFGDDHYGGGLDEANDAKRRRIPRVRERWFQLYSDLSGGSGGLANLPSRPVICVGKRK